jgi:hypothetical protein
VTLTEAVALIVPSIISGWVGMALKGVAASRVDQGKRLGALEKRLDVRDGWEAGYAKGYAAGAERETSGVPKRSDGVE